MEESKKLLRQIQVAGFAALETAMYLDTHNTDQEALKYYDKQNKKLRELEEKYTKKYGPLNLRDAKIGKTWKWSKGPWPWEYNAN